MPRHGTWTETGGGFDPGGLIQVALIAGAAAGAAVIVMEFAWLIITAGAVAVAVRLYLLYRRNVAVAAIEAKGALIREEEAARAERRELLRHQRALEIAAAGRTVIQNIIPLDPAAIAAAVAGAQQQPWAPQPQPVTIRAEVER